MQNKPKHPDIPHKHNLKYFNNNVSNVRTIRLNANASLFMSKTHTLRCIPHITGASISGPSDLNIEAGTIN